MKIGIDIRSLQEKHKSGVGEFTYELLGALFKIDAENEYHLFSNARRLVRPSLPDAGQAKIFHKHFNFPNKLLNLGFKFLNWPKIDKLVGQKLDLFIFPNLNFHALSSGIKKILFVHDLSFEIYGQFYSPKGRLWHKMTNPKKFLRTADQIIAVSKNTKDDLQNLFKLAPEKIKVIYPGVSRAYENSPPEQEIQKIKTKYSLPDKFILYLGTLEPRKNITTLVRAFEEIKRKTGLDHKLILAGARGYKSKQILKQAAKSEFANQIKYIGYIEAQEKPALYSMAALFVYPSYYEGFGFPPLEALALGTPTIVSSSGSLPEVLGEYCPILVNPYNQAELALGMEKMLQNQELGKSAQNQTENILTKYSWEKTAEELLQTINQTVS